MHGCNQWNVITVNMIIMALKFLSKYFFILVKSFMYSTANPSELPGKGFNILGRIYQTINIDKLISVWSVIHCSNYVSINCK